MNNKKIKYSFFLIIFSIINSMFAQSYFIENRRTGLRIRPENNSNQANIIQVAASQNNDFVKWERVDTSNNYFYLRNVETGKYFRPANNN